MYFTNLLFAYMSPETVLPVTSLLATVVGVAMMFGRTAYRLAVRWVRFVMTRRSRGEALKGPHFGPAAVLRAGP